MSATRGPFPAHSTPKQGLRRALGIAIVLWMGGCVPDEGKATATDEATYAIDDVISWERDIDLQENDAVINVLVRLTHDPRGGYIVADEAEGQIRQYATDGSLTQYFGRKGSGPGEFTNLHRAVRLPSGEVLALDIFQAGVVFSEDGSEVLRTFRTPIGPVHHLSIVNDTLLLIGGAIRDPAAGDPTARLHLWSLASDTLTGSFFRRSPGTMAYQTASNTAGFVSAAIRGDTIVATFALSDTLFFFDTAGNEIGRQPIPFRYFRRFPYSRPAPDARSGPVGAREWIGSFSLITDVFWLRDGRIIVQYQDRDGPVPRWRLLAMRPDGSRIFEVMDSPYLLGVEPTDDTLYFVRSSTLVQSAWSRGVLAH
jgi:hypothetical protein